MHVKQLQLKLSKHTLGNEVNYDRRKNMRQEIIFYIFYISINVIIPNKTVIFTVTLADDNRGSSLHTIL